MGSSLTVIVPYGLSQEGAKDAMLPIVCAFRACFRADLIGCACRTPTTRCVCVLLSCCSWFSLASSSSSSSLVSYSREMRFALCRRGGSRFILLVYTVANGLDHIFHNCTGYTTNNGLNHSTNYKMAAGNAQETSNPPLRQCQNDAASRTSS